MPCKGPTIEEQNRSAVQVELYDLVIDLNGAMGEETVFFDDFIDQCIFHRNEAKAVYNTEKFFHYCTSTLCDKIRKFTESEKDKYLYDGRNPISVRLAYWWQNHEKLDRERVIREAEDAAEEVAQEAADKAYEEAYDKEYKRLMMGL